MITETPFAAAPELGILARAAVVGVATGTCVTAFKLSIDAVDTTAYNAYLSSVFSAGGALAASPAGSAAVYASIPALGGLAGLLRCVTPDLIAVEHDVRRSPVAGRGRGRDAGHGTAGARGPAVRLGATVAARRERSGATSTGKDPEGAHGRWRVAGRRAPAPIAGIFYALEVSSRRSFRGRRPRLAESMVAATAVSSVLRRWSPSRRG